VASVNISESFGFNVSPELLFDSVTDPDAAERMLPAGARVERIDEQRLRIVVGQTEYELCHEDKPLRLRWRPIAGANPHGVIRLQRGPAGGTLVRVTVTAADDVESPRRVYAFLDRLNRALESLLLRSAPAVQGAKTG
jgi:hypothetical protein